MLAGRFQPAGAGCSGTSAWRKLPDIRKSQWTVDEKLTPYESVTTYNNFYEFGPDKDDPAKNAHRLKSRPWTITVEGEVKRPQTFAIEDVLKWAPLEERIYRFRCVEGWSMVVPWIGFPFSEIARRVEITGNAKYVGSSRSPMPSRCRTCAYRCSTGPMSRTAPRRSDAPADAPRGGPLR